ncbi:hypothetical protein RLEG3_18395 [Rhizobium leguminosarum bv. trifolii WSM1689]|uniref:hypothetical protein n=1 Tax=Rhizobium leguminosarum TaxID=384 RepID=UPI0003E0AC2D|nr:hypothetical protein [Rhizobium leguminosarum]AHF86705.1 hypothetical protein RLEG3_18395 [Rhizobium leguminosarum bv. trifolii WSM1689]
MLTTLSVSALWEDPHFLYWESFEEQYREPIAESKAKFEASDGVSEAREWLVESEIDPDKLPFQPKLVHVSVSRDYDLPEIEKPCGRYVYAYDGTGERDCLVFPIVDSGQTVDYGLLFIEDFEFATVRQKAIWLGGDNIDGDEIRLHGCVSDWLDAGGEGCVFIDPQRRSPLKRLQSVGKILCSDVGTALEAWEWAFGADDNELGRFEIDDTPENIEAYFRAQAERRAITQALTEKHPGRFNLVAA